MGYDIPHIVRKRRKDGDKIDIISEVPDENIEIGKTIIIRIVTPRIDLKEK